jgi:DNA-binding LacI/PurR family transcriptional regulator
MGAKDKSGQVESELRRRIVGGVYNPGEALPTEPVLAQEHGVSRMTLRKALAKLKRDGLLDCSKGAGNFVRERPRDEIAILGNSDKLYSGQGFFFLKLLERAEQLVKEAGFRPVIYIGHGSNGKELESSVKLFDPASLASCAGVISLLSPDYDVGKHLQEAGIPVVGHSVAVPTLNNCVVLDYGAFIDESMAILKSNGITEFTCFRYKFPPEQLIPGHMHHEIDRLLNAMSEKAKVRAVYIPYSSKDGSEAYALFKSLWNTPSKRPRNVFFADDSFCEFACRAALEMGVYIPSDVRFLTYTNIGRKFSHPTSMHGIGFDPREVAERKWGILKGIMDGKLPQRGNVQKIAPQICLGLSLGEKQERTA